MQKIKKALKWLVVSGLGRYLLGAILAITGVFSQYGTIGFLSTNYAIFEYTALAGVIIIVLQFIFHIGYALYSILKNNNNEQQ